MGKGKVALSRKWLIIFSCILGTLVLFLVVMNITIWIINSNRSGDELIDEDAVIVDEPFDDGISTSEDLLVYIEEMNQKISEAETDADKVRIYEERINYIADNSEFGAFADQMIADLIAIDNIEQSVDSAAQVVNTAGVYERDDVVEKYQEIMKHRKKEQGINGEVQGIG